MIFGTAGVPRSLLGASHIDGLHEIGRLGLRAMELAFVRQVNVRPADAPKVRAAAEQYGISLSVHAPYYINLNSRDARIVQASRQRILGAARVGCLCGAQYIVFHAAWRHDSDPLDLYEVVGSELLEISSRLDAEGNGVWLCPETMGRGVQFGTVDEVLRLAQDIPRVRPCLDFAHLHAMQGHTNTEQEYEAVLDAVALALGPRALCDLHMHVSGIAYGPRGEKKHLPLAESDFDYAGLLRVLHRRRVSGRVICESPTNDSDALMLSRLWCNVNGSAEVV